MFDGEREIFNYFCYTILKRAAYIDTSCDSSTSTLETYYYNFIARHICVKVLEVQEESMLADVAAAVRVSVM